MRRTLAGLAMAAPPLAAIVVLLAGAVTPGYNPVNRTISRLAVPDAPAALAVDLAIWMVAFSCFALAFALVGQSTLCRVALTVAGCALIATALIHLGRTTTLLTTAHRLSSGLAVVALTAAALALSGPYQRVSRAVGAIEMALLASGTVLLLTPFDAWGAWQRVVLAVALGWVVFVAATIRTVEARANARSAALSNTAASTPVSSVTRANP